MTKLCSPEPTAPIKPPRVPQCVIDDLLSRVSLLDLIGESTRVQHHEDEHRIVCPFHTDFSDELSMQVNATEGRFECRVCHFHGSAIGWLMYHDGLAFQEAILALARRAGVAVDTWIPDDVSESVGETTQALLAEVDDFHRDQLSRHPPALAYLESRGVSPSIAEQFALGYSPATSKAIEEAFRGRHRELWQRGLLIRQSDGTFRPRFADRLLFPIRNEHGKTVGHGARALGDTRLKYLNSPTSPLFEKSRQVYGLFEALGSTSSTPLLLVEGYLDVLALAEHGFGRAVATLGTAASAHHLRALFRHTHRLVTCFDGDAAGRKAAARLAEMAIAVLNDGQALRFAQLPPDEDPDSLLRTGGARAMRAVLADSVPLEDVLHDHLAHNLDLDAIGGKAALAARARPLVKQVRSPALKKRLIARIEKTVSIPWFDD